MKKPTPILYLDNTFTFGGAINSLLYLLRALKKEKYEAILITGQSEDFLKDKFNFIKCIPITLKLPWVHNRIYSTLIKKKFFQNKVILKLFTMLRVVYWFIFITLPEAIFYYRQGKINKVKIVHLNNIFSSQIAGILAAKFLRVPCVAHLRKFERVGAATRLYARFVDHNIAISSSIRENIIDLGISNSKITTIYDAIDLEDFNPNINGDYLNREFNIKGDEPLFGIFGRIVEWKGIEDFVHAAALVCEANPFAKAFIVGDCSDGDKAYFDKIVRLIKSYEMDLRIILTGYRNDIPAFMKRMDVVVHMSTSPEPFGMVLIEAMAMGKPVIATRIGGPMDIVEENKTGLFVAPGDYTAAAEYVKLLLRDSRLARNYGMNGRARVQKLFSKERYALEVETVYKELLKDAK